MTHSIWRRRDGRRRKATPRYGKAACLPSRAACHAARLPQRELFARNDEQHVRHGVPGGEPEGQTGGGDVGVA
jgi:hypothetical protein